MLQGPEKKSRHSKEQLHCRVARSRQAKTDTQKNNCTTLLPSPGKQNRKCKRILALKCCKVLGRKSGLEKRTTALHELPSPGKPKPDMQKDNCIAVLQGPWKKTRTCKRITALQCCKVLGRKTGHTKKTTALLCIRSRQANTYMQKSN
jgi:hypothetical protein